MEFFKLFKDPVEPESVQEEPTAPVKMTKLSTTTVVSSAASTENDYVEYFDTLDVQSDFSMFVGYLQDFASLPVTEKQKYETAFNGLKRTGVTVARILKSGDDYIARLNSELNEFTVAVNEKRQIEVLDKEAKIAEDQELIKQATMRIQDTQIEVAKAKMELDGKETNFNVAYESRLATTNDQISKITNYLNATSK